MAWVEKRGDRYHLNLEFRGQHFSRSLRTKDRKEAEGQRKRVEANLNEVERGRLIIPADVDLVLFCFRMATNRSGRLTTSHSHLANSSATTKLCQMA